MNTVKLTARLTLTCEPGSVVIVTDSQLAAIGKYAEKVEKKPKKTARSGADAGTSKGGAADHI